MDSRWKLILKRTVDRLQTTVDALTYLHNYQSFGTIGLAIHGTNLQNSLTTVACVYNIAGVPFKIAAQAQIVSPAAAVQAANSKCWYLLEIDSTGTISFIKGADSLGATAVIPARTATKALFGAIFVSLAGGATFTLGTTLFNAANVTTTFYDARSVSTLVALGKQLKIPS
jgi:hypothetical protein